MFVAFAECPDVSKFKGSFVGNGNQDPTLLNDKTSLVVKKNKVVPTFFFLVLVFWKLEVELLRWGLGLRNMNERMMFKYI